MRTWAWIAAAVAAAAALVAVALHGERPEAGLVRYKAAGVMVALPPQRATTVEVRRSEGTWRYTRTPSGWVSGPGGATGRRDATALVEQGLLLLHGSVPQRVMTGEEVRALALADVGLAPPLMTIRVEASGGALFAIDVGSPNPQGLARYARMTGHEEVVLLNHYVADPWLSLAEGP